MPASRAASVPAACTYAMIEGLLVQSTMQTTGLAMLELEMKVLKPVVAGDTVHAEVEVVGRAARPAPATAASSRPRTTS